MLNRSIFIVILIGFFSSISHAKPYSSKVHRTKLDLSIKTCTSNLKVIANEVMKLELAGLRWRSTDPKCFENLEMKYVHAIKNPDAQALKLVKVKPGSLKILSIVENKSWNNHDINFSIENVKGKIIKDTMRFGDNTLDGKTKPDTGCVILSSFPESTYVNSECL